MGLFFDSILWDVATVLSILAALVYHYLTYNFDFWKRRNVPYIKPELFYGNLKDVIHFKRDQFDLFSDFYHHFKRSGHKFGGIFQLREPVLLVCSPELVKDITVRNFPHFHDRKLPHDEHFDPLSAHLICLEGQKWKYLRSKLNPSLSSSKLKGMLGEMKEICKKFVTILEESAEKGESLEMRNSFSRYAMDIIATVAFGLRINALEVDSEFLHMGRRFFGPTQFERIVQVITNTHSWVYKTFKLRTVPKDVSEFFMGVVRDAMEYRRKENIQKNDFLHFLMKIDEVKGSNLMEMDEMKGVADYNMSVNENSIEYTEGLIAAQAFVFFLAGYETSSSTMSSCIQALAHHPEIQEEMVKEIEEIIQKHGDLTYEAIQELVYVEQVLEETLRMYPPVGMLMRQCTKPYVLPETDLLLTKGLQLFIPVYSFHYDPEYFPDPQEFRPERFSPENRKNIVPCSYIPFGYGPRICLGMRLAMMEMKLTIALIVKNFKIMTCEKTKPVKIDPKCFFLASINGYWVRLAKRQ